jgi:uncharacterized membrane protein
MGHARYRTTSGMIIFGLRTVWAGLAIAASIIFFFGGPFWLFAAALGAPDTRVLIEMYGWVESVVGENTMLLWVGGSAVMCLGVLLVWAPVAWALSTLQKSVDRNPINIDNSG